METAATFTEIVASSVEVTLHFHRSHFVLRYKWRKHFSISERREGEDRRAATTSELGLPHYLFDIFRSLPWKHKIVSMEGHLRGSRYHFRESCYCFDGSEVRSR